MADIPVQPRRRSPLALLLPVLLVVALAALALWYFTERGPERAAARDAAADERAVEDDGR